MCGAVSNIMRALSRFSNDNDSGGVYHIIHVVCCFIVFNPSDIFPLSFLVGIRIE